LPFEESTGILANPVRNLHDPLVKSIEPFTARARAAVITIPPLAGIVSRRGENSSPARSARAKLSPLQLPFPLSVETT
jgi:hypothetical protein